MNSNSIAFALITFYPKWYRGKLRSLSHADKIRGDLALDFIKKAISKNYQVVVVDGLSSKTFRKQLNNFPNAKVIKRRGYKRSPARRQAFKAASKLPNVKVIISTEAEKVSLIDSTPIISKPIFDKAADIVVPKREEKLFKKTHPDYMYESEVEANILFNEQLKLHNLIHNENFDMCFGPRVFVNDPHILSLFTKKYLFKLDGEHLDEEYFDPEQSSNTQSFPVVMALKKGIRVRSIKIPFSYPRLQKMNEEKGEREFFMAKRRAQKLSILLEMMYLLNYFKK